MYLLSFNFKNRYVTNNPPVSNKFPTPNELGA